MGVDQELPSGSRPRATLAWGIVHTHWRTRCTSINGSHSSAPITVVRFCTRAPYLH